MVFYWPLQNVPAVLLNLHGPLKKLRWNFPKLRRSQGEFQTKTNLFHHRLKTRQSKADYRWGQASDEPKVGDEVTSLTTKPGNQLETPCVVSYFLSLNIRIAFCNHGLRGSFRLKSLDPRNLRFQKCLCVLASWWLNEPHQPELYRICASA
jgi:hypothetical protein